MSDAWTARLLVALMCCSVPLVVPIVAVALSYRRRRLRDRGVALARDLGLSFEEARTALDGAIDAQAGSADPRAVAASRGFAGLILGIVDAWRIHGRLEGRLVEIRLVSRGSSKQRTTYTRVEMKLEPPLGLGLRVSREGLLTQLGKQYGGAKEVTLGDPRVDPVAFIVASDPAGAAALLQPPHVKQALVAMLGAIDAMVTDEHVAVELRGTVLEAARVRPILATMRPLVDALAVPSGPA